MLKKLILNFKKYMTNIISKTLCLFFILITIFGCQNIEELKKKANKNTSFNWNRSLRVAVLPFLCDNWEIEKDIRVEAEKHLRKEFVKNFAVLNFSDVEIKEVDNFLKNKKFTTLKIIENLELVKQLKDLNIDLILYSEIKDYSYTNLAVAFERYYVEMKLSIVDVNTGKIIWSHKDDESKNINNASISITGIISSAANAIMRDSPQEEVNRKLCEKFIKLIPKSEFVEKIKVDNVKLLTEKAKIGIKQGDDVTIEIKATPGKKVVFKVGDSQIENNSIEKHRGIYHGNYKVNEKLPNGYISVQAQCHNKKLGKKSNWVRLKNAILIDQIPPVFNNENFNIKSDNKNISLTWQSIENEENLTYEIFRKSKNETRYKKIGSTQNLIFSDNKLKPYLRYYYFIRPVDKSNNKGKYSKILSSSIIKFSSQTINSTNEMPKDFFKAASPYKIKGDIVIPKDNTLEIEPGVKIEFNGNGKISCYGEIIANGTKEDPISFIGSNKINHLSFRKDSKGTLNNCNFVNSKNTLIVDGARIKLNKVNIKGDEIGILIKNNSEITINESSLENCKNVAIELKDNSILRCLNSNFINNSKNILSKSSNISIDSNWWGKLDREFSLNQYGIFGKASINRILDQSYPKGTSFAITAISDIYDFMNAKGGSRRMYCDDALKKDPYYRGGYIWLIKYYESIFQPPKVEKILKEAKRNIPNFEME